MNLIVIEPFQSYARGALITDAAAIAAVLASGHAASVVRVPAASEAAPPAPAKSSPPTATPPAAAPAS